MTALAAMARSSDASGSSLTSRRGCWKSDQECFDWSEVVRVLCGWVHTLGSTNRDRCRTAPPPRMVPVGGAGRLERSTSGSGRGSRTPCPAAAPCARHHMLRHDLEGESESQ